MRLTSKILLAVIILAAPAFADKLLTELPVNPGPAPTDIVYCVQGSTDYQCTLQQIQAVAGVNVDYYLTDTVSDIGGYAVIEADATGQGEVSIPAAIIAADTLIKAWGTIASEPQFTVLVKGVYDVHIHAAKTAGVKDAFIYAKLFKRASGGAETLLFTTENSPLLTGSAIEYDIHGSLLADETLLADDRLVLKVYGSPSGLGTDPDIAVYIEGVTASRIEIKTTSAATDARYLTKPGLSGGQVAYGGTGSGDDLSLNSTTHATKGNINFGSASTYNEVTDSWGIGDTAPTHQIDAKLRADDNILIDARTLPRAMTQGVMRFEHTPSMAGTRAINIDINSNGQSDTNAIVVDYTATNHTAEFETHALDVSVDTDGSTGGDFQGISVSKIGSGTLDVSGLEVYSGVNPVLQKSGSALAIDTAFTYSGAAFTDITTNINSTGSNSQLFAADNDYLYLGQASQFNEIHFVFAVLSSNSISPIFEYSQGAGVWNAFGPADGTNGMQQNGNIVWGGTLTGWATDTVNGQGGRYWVRIQRTRNTLSTPPTESIVKAVTTSDYSWNANGDVIVNAINAKGNSYFGLPGSSSHPIEARKDGAGFQTILAVENQQAAAANVGPQIMFEGASNTDMASVQSGWNGAATTDAYIAWSTRSGNAMGERMRLTSAGNLGMGATPVNKLDVEGGVAIGVTFSGASTAPSSGAIIEGQVGVGTASPGTAKLNVYGGSSANSSYGTFSQLISGNYSGQYGVYGLLADTSTGAGPYVKYGVTGNAAVAGGTATANTGTLGGVYGSAYHAGTGTLANLAGFLAEAGPYTYGADTGTGTVTNVYGVKVSHLKDTGATITNGYGVHVSGTKGTAAYDIYASTSTAKNYLEGNTGIGTASPTDKLDVNGDTIRIRTSKTPASAADTCDGGEIAWDASYVYVCVAANSWKRAAIAAW